MEIQWSFYQNLNISLIWYLCILPYFLSNNGLSIQNGQIVSVNKGKWDKSEGFEYVNDFNRKWLSLVREKMKDDATIWISGTMHNIFSIGQILTELRV